MLIPIVCFQQAGTLLVAPALPQIKTRFFGSSSSKAAIAQGLVDSSSAALNILVSAALGKMSDMAGRRPVILFNIVCTAAPIVALVQLVVLLYGASTWRARCWRRRAANISHTSLYSGLF